MMFLTIALVTYANGIVSTKFLNDKNIEIRSLLDENKRLAENLKKYETEGNESDSHNVRARKLSDRFYTGHSRGWNANKNSHSF